MDLYFFLDSKEFDPVISVCNYPPTGSLALGNSNDVYICYAYPEGGSWVIKTYKKFSNMSCETIQWSDLNLRRETIAKTLVFLANEPMNGLFECLPEIHQFESVPSWRGNLKIMGSQTSVSYQGEFPYAMTKIKGGSIISLMPKFPESQEANHYLFYVSFLNTPEIRFGEVKIINAKSRALLHTFKVVSNSVNCLKLPNLKQDDSQLLLIGSGVMGIPIFFSEEDHGKRMSLEHAMAPSEYAIHGELDVRRGIMQKMKSYWS